MFFLVDLDFFWNVYVENKMCIWIFFFLWRWVDGMRLVCEYWDFMRYCIGLVVNYYEDVYYYVIL